MGLEIVLRNVQHHIKKKLPRIEQLAHNAIENSVMYLDLSLQELVGTFVSASQDEDRFSQLITDLETWAYTRSHAKYDNQIIGKRLHRYMKQVARAADAYITHKGKLLGVENTEQPRVLEMYTTLRPQPPTLHLHKKAA